MDSIHIEDETFRISEVLDSDHMQNSLREIGQVNPVVLLRDERERTVIVCGFRRIRALARIGGTHALAQVLSAVEYSPLRAFRVALWDNLAHRLLCPLETARALFGLKNTCGVDHDTLIDNYLPLLGLAPHKNVLRSYLRLHLLHPKLKELLNQGSLTLSSAARLSGKTCEDQKLMALVFGKARWSASRQRQFLDLVEELAAMGGCPANNILTRREVGETMDDSRLTPFQRGERVYEILYRMRNPGVARAEERFLSEKRKLGLPGDVRLSPEPFFETPRMRVAFDACSAERFREIAAALERASRAPELDALFRVS